MSISRVWIRFNIADNQLLPNVNYSATCFTMPKPTLCPEDKNSKVVSLSCKETVDKHRGRRSHGPITVENHLVGADPMSSPDNPDTDSLSADIVDGAGPIVSADQTDRDKQPAPTLELDGIEELPAQLDTTLGDVPDQPGSRPGSGRTRHKSHSPAEKSPSALHFFSGNPMVETTEGIIHLYKDNFKSSLDPGEERPDMLCMLAVPASMGTKDLIDFAAPAMPGIAQMKIIRDPTPSQFMVLLKFRTQEDGDEFYRSYNNRQFNSIEPEICHLVYVARVEAISQSDGACFPIPGWTELPYCPVCLESMDESVDGILTVLCNHSFHGNCLSQWSDTSCPVCRFLQTPEPVADNVCMQCDSPENLWICLICGHVGCGRYQGGHARRHYEETQHTYSMQLGNNRVWDYAGDNYVHRLVQNKGDGKLVEVSDELMDNNHDEKFDSITLEYTYLLTSQLESQRLYFEEKMALIEQQAFSTMGEVEFRSKKSSEECEKLEKELSNSRKDKHQIEKKVAGLSEKLHKVLRELQEEQDMNQCLRDNQKSWQDQVSKLQLNSAQSITDKEQELRDVREQLRDVMVHLEAQNDLSHTELATQNDIQAGSIFVPESAAGGATGRNSRKKSKKPR